MNKKFDLGNDRIAPLLFKMAIPTLVAQIINLIYSIVDRIYIGHMEGSDLALSAVSISIPVVTIILAVTNLIGLGGAPLAAMRMGAKKQDDAEKITTTAFMLLCITGIALIVCITIFLEPILYLFGASDDNIELAKSYAGIYAFGTLSVQIATGMNPYINAQGRTTLGMTTVLIGAIINIILDPIFIFTFGLGVQGAALATVLAQTASATWVVLFLFSKNNKLRIRREYVKFDLKIILPILALGITPFTMAFTESLVQISFNNQMSKFGGTLAVGAMAILLSLYQVFNTLLMGFAQGATPLLSFNYGARKYDRVRQAFKLFIKVTLTVSITLSICVLLFAEQVISLFTNDENIITIASWGVIPFLIGSAFFGILSPCQQSFVALGQGKTALFIASFRKIILLVPLIYIMPAILGNLEIVQTLAEPISGLVDNSGQIFGVLLAESLSDIISASTAGIAFLFFYRKHLTVGAILEK